MIELIFDLVTNLVRKIKIPPHPRKPILAYPQLAQTPVRGGPTGSIAVLEAGLPGEAVCQNHGLGSFAWKLFRQAC